MVGFQLVDQADAAAFLRQIEQDASFGLGDLSSDNSSCARQSQRSEWKTSPVRHCEWMRTSGAFARGEVAVADGDGLFALALGVRAALDGVDC